jgi:hypothetical protein
MDPAQLARVFQPREITAQGCDRGTGQRGEIVHTNDAAFPQPCQDKLPSFTFMHDLKLVRIAHIRQQAIVMPHRSKFSAT